MRVKSSRRYKSYSAIATISVVSCTVLNAVEAIATLGTIIRLLSIHADVIEVHRLCILVVSCAATIEIFRRLTAHVLAKRRERIVSGQGLSLEGS